MSNITIKAVSYVGELPYLGYRMGFNLILYTVIPMWIS